MYIKVVYSLQQNLFVFTDLLDAATKIYGQLLTFFSSTNQIFKKKCQLIHASQWIIDYFCERSEGQLDARVEMT